MRADGSARLTYLLLVLIVVGAAALRFTALDFGLPHTEARPDERVIIDGARGLLAGEPLNFYDYPRFFMYAAAATFFGYFTVGAIAGWFGSMGDMLASWPLHWEPFFLMVRVLSAVAGTATVLVAYRLGRLLRDRTTGLASAFFVALSFFHISQSHFGTTDITMTLLVTLAVTFVLDAHRTRSLRRFAVAGLAAGLAAGTKYNGVLLVAPLAVSAVLYRFEAPDRRAALGAALPAFLLPFTGAFLLCAPFIINDWHQFRGAMDGLERALIAGDPRLQLVNGWTFYVAFPLRYGLGLPLLVVGGGGLLWMLAGQTRAALIVLSFPVIYYAVAASVDLLFFRYALPLVPFLCVGAGYAVSGLRRLAPSRMPLVGAAAVGIAAVLVALPSLERALAFNRIAAQEDTRVLLARWFETRAPPRSSLLQSGGRYGHAQFARDLEYNVWTWDSARKAFMLHGIRATGLPDYIVLQDSPLPSSTQDAVKRMLTQGYAPVDHIRGFHPADGLVYDRLDQFYIPVNGFAAVRRPGPNFSIYQRVEVAPR